MCAYKFQAWINLVPENKVDELKKLNLSIANRSEKSFEKEEINLLK